MIPHSPEHEKRLIATLLDNYEAGSANLNGLKPEHFYNELCRKTFGLMQELYSAGRVPDLLTVADAGEHKGLSATDLFDLSSNEFKSVEFVKSDEAAIMDAYHLREYQRILDKAKQAIEEGATASDVQALLLNTAEAQGTRRGFTGGLVADFKEDFCERLNERYQNPGVHGIKTGFSTFDEMTGGFDPGDLVIIGARTSHGKTAFALNIAQNTSKANISTLFLSVEMTIQALDNRLISQATRVPLHKIKSGDLTKDEFNKLIRVKSNQQNQPLHLYQTSTNPMELISFARLQIKKHNIKLVFLDYLQLLNTGKKEETRNLELSKFTWLFKQLALETQTVVVLLSQLNRDASGKRPASHHLRDSGAIEQDADLVVLLNRPEFDGLDSLNDSAKSPAKGAAELLVTKNRQGATGYLKLTYLAEFTQFTEYAKEMPF